MACNDSELVRPSGWPIMPTAPDGTVGGVGGSCYEADFAARVASDALT